MTLAEEMAPRSSASKLATLTEWATPRSSAWRIRSFASRGCPSRSAMFLVWAGSVDTTRNNSADTNAAAAYEASDIVEGRGMAQTCDSDDLHVRGSLCRELASCVV